ncbi:MAG: beta-N-acetylhexosaminidase [Longimicrobiales bacterium]
MLIGVDQEGGRVQRFRGDFTSLPACRCFGRCYNAAPAEALELARQAGWLMAAELLAAGVDFSFAPVLDLDKGMSPVIGDRAFHRDPETVAVLARKFMQGMRSAGMGAVGKHFPGHGSVAADSHFTVPVDERPFEDIAMADMVAFERLISAGLPAIMPAHVVFAAVDPLPAGFSSKWIGEVLRRQLGFQGAVISDDLSMAGAEMLGGYRERAEAALRAGCDVVLVCNNQKEAIKLVESLEREPSPASQVRLMRLHGTRSQFDLDELKRDKAWKSAAAALATLDRTPELGLGDDSIHS